MANPSRAEIKRLNRILYDETYGPKLVRLNRGQQREILDLIEQNRGREARQRILELDESRRTHRRVRRRTWRGFAEWLRDNVDDRLDVDEYVEYAEQNATGDDYDAMQFAVEHHWTADEVAEQASRDAVAHVTYSPFWYHSYAVAV